MDEKKINIFLIKNVDGPRQNANMTRIQIRKAAEFPNNISFFLASVLHVRPDAHGLRACENSNSSTRYSCGNEKVL